MEKKQLLERMKVRLASKDNDIKEFEETIEEYDIEISEIDTQIIDIEHEMKISESYQKIKFDNKIREDYYKKINKFKKKIIKDAYITSVVGGMVFFLSSGFFGDFSLLQNIMYSCLAGTFFLGGYYVAGYVYPAYKQEEQINIIANNYDFFEYKDRLNNLKRNKENLLEQKQICLKILEIEKEIVERERHVISFTLDAYDKINNNNELSKQEIDNMEMVMYLEEERLKLDNEREKHILNASNLEGELNTNIFTLSEQCYDQAWYEGMNLSLNDELVNKEYHLDNLIYELRQHIISAIALIPTIPITYLLLSKNIPLILSVHTLLSFGVASVTHYKFNKLLEEEYKRYNYYDSKKESENIEIVSNKIIELEAKLISEREMIKYIEEEIDRIDNLYFDDNDEIQCEYIEEDIYEEENDKVLKLKK